MKFSFAHNNINVKDLDKSVAFYKEALLLEECKQLDAPDGSFKLRYLKSPYTQHELELTWLRDWDRPYNLGDNEFHLAFYVDDFEAAHAKHKEMGCIAYENLDMGIYFIADPDGYWTEIIPAGAY
ncbi:MAG: VOC family protein [Veillonella sp.]|nr:VOC family protein [Veillonella sp.]MCF0155775.1 VOC family protein [Veillonella sp.]